MLNILDSWSWKQPWGQLTSGLSQSLPEQATHGSCPHPGPLRKKSKEINNSLRAFFPSPLLPSFCLFSPRAFPDECTMCLKLFISLSRISTMDELEYHIFLTADSCTARGQNHYVLGQKAGPGAEMEALLLERGVHQEAQVNSGHGLQPCTLLLAGSAGWPMCIHHPSHPTTYPRWRKESYPSSFW